MVCYPPPPPPHTHTPTPPPLLVRSRRCSTLSTHASHKHSPTHSPIKKVSHSHKVASRIDPTTSLSKGEKPPWFYTLNPRGTIPVAEIDGRLLTESEDILDELERGKSHTHTIFPICRNPFFPYISGYSAFLVCSLTDPFFPYVATHFPYMSNLGDICLRAFSVGFPESKRMMPKRDSNEFIRMAELLSLERRRKQKQKDSHTPHQKESNTLPIKRVEDAQNSLLHSPCSPSHVTCHAVFHAQKKRTHQESIPRPLSHPIWSSPPRVYRAWLMCLTRSGVRSRQTCDSALESLDVVPPLPSPLPPPQPLPCPPP